MEELRQELEDFFVDVRDDNALSNLLRVGQKLDLNTTQLVNEWVSFSKNAKGECPLNDVCIERFGSQLQIRQSKHTPSSRKTVPRANGQKIYTKDNLSELFGIDVPDITGGNDEENIDLINTYAGVTPNRSSVKAKGTKRVMSSPVTPVSKVTPSFPKTPTNFLPEDRSPSNTFLSETPSGKYSHRSNKGNIVCDLNPSIVISNKLSFRKPNISIYGDRPLDTVPKHMYQKGLERATVLKDRLEEFGESVCRRYKRDSQSDSTETPIYVGIVACDGEGRLNANSCLLECVGLSWKSSQTCSLQLVIPDGFHSCSLFPGQIVAVEGQLHDDSNTLIASRIFDEGCLPPSPDRKLSQPVGGFSMMVAAGPFTTSDNLDMIPLHDLLAVVATECPSVLLLMGPFLDASHDEVKEWSLAELQEDFLLSNVFGPVVRTCRKSNTQVVIVPSQRDVAHPWTVYPQPPFAFDKKTSRLLSDVVTFVSDPAIISINGVHMGLSSTDILFHLNSLALFVGPTSDRMSKLASHVIHQQSFYPLYPPYCRGEPDVSSDHTPYLDCTSDVNLDLLLAYDERHALLPVLPDILVLTSDLKPFVKTVDGCLCVNTGHLTKKAAGGTYSNVTVRETLAADLPNNTRIQISCI